MQRKLGLLTLVLLIASSMNLATAFGIAGIKPQLALRSNARAAWSRVLRSARNGMSTSKMAVADINSEVELDRLVAEAGWA